MLFSFAIIIGFYSLILFFLGVFGIAYTSILQLLNIFWIAVLFLIYKKTKHQPIQFNKTFTLWNLLLILVLLQIAVNFIGALGPELAFDALWYHLTIPKIFLLHHKIFHIPGLLYYSDMPKLGEMLYMGGLSLGSEIVTKLIHFSFGIVCCIGLYQLSKRFMHPVYALLSVIIFYSNLVVGWEAITAYIDLIRTFFEIMAIYAWIIWAENKQQKWFYLSAVLLGLAITTKLLAFGSLIIITVLSVVYFMKQKSNFTYVIIRLFTYWIICLLIPLPWFIFSYINTGNPVYPFFNAAYPIHETGFSLVTMVKTILSLFMNSADPISPIYLIMLPIILVNFFKLKKIFYFLLYATLAIICWYFTPQTGGGRFILPYLPIFSLLLAYCVSLYKDQWQQKIFIIIIIILSIISIGYRGLANAKYLPVILGKETKQIFLTNHLNFSFGDFYDTDNFFKNNIKPTDRVLLIGFHNLYYVNFPFIDNSWITPSDTFTYIATQKTSLPKIYQLTWKEIYYNPKTFVRVYTKSHE